MKKLLYVLLLLLVSCDETFQTHPRFSYIPKHQSTHGKLEMIYFNEISLFV